MKLFSIFQILNQEEILGLTTVLLQSLTDMVCIYFLETFLQDKGYCEDTANQAQRGTTRWNEVFDEGNMMIIINFLKKFRLLMLELCPRQ